jgi:hypothetical protein
MSTSSRIEELHRRTGKVMQRRQRHHRTHKRSSDPQFERDMVEALTERRGKYEIEFNSMRVQMIAAYAEWGAYRIIDEYRSHKINKFCN